MIESASDGALFLSSFPTQYILYSMFMFYSMIA
ncbi:hypothetical protein VSF3289_00781 [Vibrio scophthalmi]|uniref:Uncharacterized protein n=1 Tax=Vibrio scophthalmi TaxID=45658 RepID=A0A1E3WNG6_9VIBR|nr:hypothetical protein VSF3289_00781 [Vibrio scophthalmi]